MDWNDYNSQCAMCHNKKRVIGIYNHCRSVLPVGISFTMPNVSNSGSVRLAEDCSREIRYKLQSRWDLAHLMFIVTKQLIKLLIIDAGLNRNKLSLNVIIQRFIAHIFLCLVILMHA